MTASEHPGSGRHGPAMAAYLLINGVMSPPLLSQPYTFAVLSWGGGIAVNVIMAVASWYCMYHQATLFHHKGGRHSTYKRMGNAVLGPYMGRWGGVLIAGLQYFINVGSTITNTILAGQLLQDVYKNLCTDKAHCTFTGTSAWIGLAGLLSYAVFMAVPDMSTLAWASICGTAFAIYFSIAGMVMAGLDGNASTAKYYVSGTPQEQVFNALNGIGMLLFMYGVTVLPEIQDVLRSSPKTGNTSRYMVQAATVAHFVFVPLYMLVGIIGYWSYGADVNAFLLFANSRPTGLVASAELAAAVQIQLVSQVMMLPVFEAAERSILGLFPNCNWLAAPQPKATPGGAISVTCLTPAATLDSELTHFSTLASHMSALARSLSGGGGGGSILHPGSQNNLELGVAGSILGAAGMSAQEKHDTAGKKQQQGVCCAIAACDADAQHDAAVNSAGCGVQVSAEATAVTAAAEGRLPRPGLVLMIANRTLITGLMVLVACALPFFSSIMGAVGAIGFGPITYALPTVLYMVAFGSGMSRLEWWFNALFVAFWLLVSIAGAVGAVYSIVATASTYHFFS